MITRIYSHQEPPSSYEVAIFLMGPTPRDNNVKSWRTEALQILEKIYANKPINLVIFIPETENYDYLTQVEWEKQHIEMADVILTWLPQDMDTSLKGLTTNIEFGKYIESGKLFYGRPDTADNIMYLDWMYSDITKRKPINSLPLLCKEIARYLNPLINSNSLRVEGERYIPLHIWHTPQFQNWYQLQIQAGNKLISAKLLWLFTIPSIDFIFSYAIHVNIWIKAENRIKSNEFIISRPDISVVVAYWKHPTYISASEIILIKEFRSPARTGDGFVHELPGGSSFKNSENCLQLACDELHEETGLKIESNRFNYIASKQLASTWSTHFADVYAVKLNKSEIEQAKANAHKTFGVMEDSEKTYVEVYTLAEAVKNVDWSMAGIIYQVLIDQ